MLNTFSFCSLSCSKMAASSSSCEAISCTTRGSTGADWLTATALSAELSELVAPLSLEIANASPLSSVKILGFSVEDMLGLWLSLDVWGDLYLERCLFTTLERSIGEDKQRKPVASSFKKTVHRNSITSPRFSSQISSSFMHNLDNCNRESIYNK